MKIFIIISILLSVIVLPCFNQQSSKSETVTSEVHVECTPGITSFATSCSSEMLDSVVHFQFKDNQPDPNISSRVFYFDQGKLLDSIVERYRDNIYNYTSGYTTRYTYDNTARVNKVFKTSWNDQIRHLLILIRESYSYDADGSCTRNSNIEWRTAHDTSSLDVHEAYAYDTSDQLAAYTMLIPPEINPDNAIYKEVYRYDSIGGITYESKDLSEEGERLTLVETMYQNAYREENLPWWIRSSKRENGQGDWQQAGQWHYFYDENSRVTMLAGSSVSDNGPLYEKQYFTYDAADNVIRKVRYISPDSVHYQVSDSILFYHALTETEKEKEEEEEEEIEEEELPDTSDPLEFKLFPNPTDGILHVRSGIDFPAAIRVIDASGKILFTRRIETGVTDIDLSPYPAGYYIITLTSNSDYQTGKVFKY
jgi:hypothetical protein